jgi:hypothetical protein
VQMFYSAGVSPGGDTVTVVADAGPGTNPWTGLWLQEYSGAATSDVVDVSSAQFAPDASWAVRPGPMQVSRCALVVSAFVDGDTPAQNLDAGSSFIFRSTDLWDPGAAIDNAPNGSQPGDTVNAEIDMTLRADSNWVAVQMAFRSANSFPPLQPTGLAFPAPAPSALRNTCGGPLTVQTQDPASTPLATSNGLPVSLSATGMTFYADPACAYPVPALFIGAGTSTQNVWFMGSVPGAVTVHAGSALGNAQQMVLIN